MAQAASDDCIRSWWREPQLLVLLLVVFGIYFTRITTLTIRGEESRRARVAVEILESGDWIVPTQQGQIYLSRPPLGSYPIALLGMLRGKVDLLAVRLPTVTAVLLTCVLIYGYARTFLSANGSLAAALAFGTMGQVMEIGRLAETEATFTLLVAGSLLLWHWGYSRAWPAWLTWSIGYTFCALAGLAKGPQGPVYFVAVAGVYLCVRRDWKMLFNWQHAVGLAAFAVVLGSWQLPYFLRTDLTSSIGIWTNNAAQRFEENGTAQTLLKHLAAYPFEVLACMLPWSLLLLRYGDRRLLASLGTARLNVGFLVTAILVTFPSVWLASTAKGRYYMPLYPCFAMLIGIVIDRCLVADFGSHLRNVCRNYARLITGGLVAAAIVVATASWLPIAKLEPIAQPAGFAALYLLVVFGGVWIVLKLQRLPVVPLVTLAVLLGTTSTGVVLNSYVKKANDTQLAVTQVKQKLPPGQKLVSFGRVDHLFAYHFEEPIPFCSLPKTATEVDESVEYFAIDGGPKPIAELPFAWEEVATVVLDRNQMEKPARTVIIGRRLESSIAQQADNPQMTRTPRRH
jgi:4-amino-4-deoxy-L-arabinose transferase-like glycosyltransferase